MRHASVFSGIGGPDLAAEWMGWENVFHCEWNEFGKRVLKYYWPNATSYDDITKTDFTIHRGTIDVLTGGFPCQPYSSSGSRKGKDDERHLWPEMLRAIREIKPRWVVGENVSGIANWNGGVVFEEIQGDLENQGYKIQPVFLPAVSIGADHLRERVWFVAYASSMGRSNAHGNDGAIAKKTCNTERSFEKSQWRSKETDVLDPSCNTFLRYETIHGRPPIFNLDDGLSIELDGITLLEWIKEGNRAAGNAIDPRVIFQIFKTIESYELSL